MATVRPVAPRRPAAVPSPKPAAAPQRATAVAVAVQEPQGFQMALPSDVVAQLAQAAKDASSKERPSLGRFSLRGGTLSYGGNPMPNNAVNAVIIANAFRNVYYSQQFDPDNPVNPDCFALSEDDPDQMEAHENVAETPHDDADDRKCLTCPMFQWGSSPTSKRGKACKQTRRLIVLPEDALEGGPEAVLTAELAILDVPVTSVRHYSNFVSGLAASANLPPYAVITAIQLHPDPKTMIKLSFTAIRSLPSAEVLQAVMRKREDALRIALQPYDSTGGEADPEAATPATQRAPARPAARRKF